MAKVGIELYTGDAYASSNPAWHDEDADWKASQVTYLLARNGCRPHKIVDVGCGAGGVLHAVLETLGPDAEGDGFDISQYAIGMAKKKTRQRLAFHCTNFLESNRSGYDLCLCIDVFEHVEDFMGFLRTIRDRSAHFVFHIPLDMNVKGLLRQHHMKERKKVGHIHYFDYLTALATLRDAGYDVIDRVYTRKPDSRLLTKAIWGCQKVLSAVSGEDLAVHLLGGASLLVLARNQSGP